MQCGYPAIYLHPIPSSSFPQSWSQSVCAESDAGSLFLHSCTESGKSALIENPVRGGEITSSVEASSGQNTKDAAEVESFTFTWENVGNKRTSEANCDRRTCSVRCDW